jgi:hypothetical protein
VVLYAARIWTPLFASYAKSTRGHDRLGQNQRKRFLDYRSDILEALLKLLKSRESALFVWPDTLRETVSVANAGPISWFCLKEYLTWEWRVQYLSP